MHKPIHLLFDRRTTLIQSHSENESLPQRRTQRGSQSKYGQYSTLAFGINFSIFSCATRCVFSTKSRNTCNM